MSIQNLFSLTGYFNNEYIDSCIPYPRDLELNLEEIKNEQQDICTINEYARLFWFEIKYPNEKLIRYRPIERVMYKYPYKYDFRTDIPISILREYTLIYQLVIGTNSVGFKLSNSNMDPLILINIRDSESVLPRHVQLTRRMSFNATSYSNNHQSFRLRVYLEHNISKTQHFIYLSDRFIIRSRKQYIRRNKK